MKYHLHQSRLFSSVFIALALAVSSLPVVVGATGVDFDPSDSELIGDLVGSSIQQDTGLGITEPTAVVLDLVNLSLSLLGGLSVILLVYAGFLWVWARGNSDEIDKAKQIILGTVIGLAIIFASLGIARFVFSNVADITGANYQVNSED